jgi:hypothetical protein
MIETGRYKPVSPKKWTNRLTIFIVFSILNWVVFIIYTALYLSKFKWVDPRFFPFFIIFYLVFTVIFGFLLNR